MGELTNLVRFRNNFFSLRISLFVDFNSLGENLSAPRLKNLAYDGRTKGKLG
jgi:hypothetical protein